MFDRRGQRKYLNAAERAAFGRAAETEPDARRRAFCLTLFCTGCRISEALQLTAERVDVAEKSVVLETLKRRQRGHFRSVPIPQDLLNLLLALTVTTEPSGQIWSFSRSTGYRLIKEKMREAELTGANASPKGLRHGFGVACVAANVPLTTIKKWLGHAKLETTAIYLDVVGVEERDLAKRLWLTASEG